MADGEVRVKITADSSQADKAVDNLAAKTESKVGKAGSVFDKIGSRASSAFGNVTQAVANVGQKAAGAFSGIGDKISGLGSRASSAFGGIGGVIGSVGQKAAGAFTGIGERISSAGATASAKFAEMGASVTSSTSAAGAAMGNLGSATEGAGSKMAGAFNGMKVAAAAAAAAAAKAVVDFTQAAVSAYGRYEQLSGGVDTLFKGSADQVRAYADQAYKTAGVSANQYMDQITSFSASLLQSLGGDTAKAADMGNMAVIDMADNANKMGSNMTDVQNAYQGFAKQNYTMLDNLSIAGGITA